MSKETDEHEQRLALAQDLNPKLDITLPNKAPISLQIPSTFWEDTCQLFYEQHTQIGFTKAFLKAIVTKALSAAVKASNTSSVKCRVVDGVPLKDEEFLLHAWAIEPDPSVASASLGDTDKTGNPENLNTTLAQNHQTLMAELAIVKSDLATLKSAFTSRTPKKHKQIRKELPLRPFTNMTGGLIAKLPDVVERLRQFKSKFAPPPGPFDYDLVQEVALSFPTVLNFAASLLQIPATEHMPTTNSDTLANCGKQDTSIVDDFTTNMTVASRLSLTGSTIDYKDDNDGGSPLFLEYEQDVLFIFKLHLSPKNDGKKQFAYIGYFPICRTFVYASDWATHPFTDGHSSRYLNDEDQKIPVHFWHIAKTNITDKNDLFRAISHRLFKTKENDKLAWVSMAILDPCVKKDKKKPPYDNSKTPVNTPKRRNSTSSTKTADSASSDCSSSSISTRTRTAIEKTKPSRPRLRSGTYKSNNNDTKRQKTKKH